MRSRDRSSIAATQPLEDVFIVLIGTRTRLGKPRLLHHADGRSVLRDDLCKYLRSPGFECYGGEHDQCRGRGAMAAGCRCYVVANLDPTGVRHTFEAASSYEPRIFHAEDEECFRPRFALS